MTFAEKLKSIRKQAGMSQEAAPAPQSANNSGGASSGDTRFQNAAERSREASAVR